MQHTTRKAKIKILAMQQNLTSYATEKKKTNSETDQKTSYATDKKISALQQDRSFITGSQNNKLPKTKCGKYGKDYLCF